MADYFDETIDDICDYIKNNKEILLFLMFYLLIKNIFLEIRELF